MWMTCCKPSKTSKKRFNRDAATATGLMHNDPMLLVNMTALPPQKPPGLLAAFSLFDFLF